MPNHGSRHGANGQRPSPGRSGFAECRQPQLQLFDANGESRGQSIGLRQPQELSAIAVALETGEPLPTLAGIGAISSLDPSEEPSRRDISSNVGPRSHG